MIPQLQPDVEMNQMMILILLVSLPLLLEELEERDAMQKQRETEKEAAFLEFICFYLEKLHEIWWAPCEEDVFWGITKFASMSHMQEF